MCLDIKVCEIEKKYSTEPNYLILSEKFRLDSIFTTRKEHILSTRCDETNLGRQVITKGISSLKEDDVVNIDELGIIKPNTFVNPGDILVCKGIPDYDSPLTKLTYSIFAEPLYKDASLRAPYNVHGVITNVQLVYAKDKIGNTINGAIESVTITILQELPISIGDILIDELGNEGVVESFDSNLRDYSIVANFHICGKILKKSIAEQSIQVRSIGQYDIYNRPFLVPHFYNNTAQIISEIPQNLYPDDIAKFFNNSLGDVLKNIITFQSDDPENRMKLYECILRNKPTDYFCFSKYDINEFYCLLNALCLKPIFRNENGDELFFSFLEEKSELEKFFGENLSLEIVELTDSEIAEMSYGEVLNNGTINFRKNKPDTDGLFCEKIFGPTENYKCRCGKYARIRYNGITCENCGVEVTNSKVRYARFGHIDLASPIHHPFSNRMITVLPVLPPQLRPIIRLCNGQITSSDLNELYQRIISRNNHLKSLIKNGTSVRRIHKETLLLQEAVELLFISPDLKEKISTSHNYTFNSLTNRIKELLTKHLNCVPLDYTACCNIVIDNSLSNKKCGIPYQIAVELFKPFLVSELCKEKIVETLNDAKHFIQQNSAESRKKKISELLKKILERKQILVYSKNKSAEVLALTPFLTELNVLTVNMLEYNKLQPQIDESIKIILPVSDVAQKMIQHLNKNLNKKNICGLRQEGCKEVDKEYTAFLTKEPENLNIAPLLLKYVQNHEICHFNNSISRYIFCKPTKLAWGFYDQNSTVNE